MPTNEMNTRDALVVQYLNDAYATERRLEIALQAHIDMTPRADYKKRLREHLKETKAHARLVARRIKALGGEAETVHVPGPEAVAKGAKNAKAAVQKAAAAVQGPLHAVRGTGPQERMLKNAQTEYQDEAHEIATYRALEALAKGVGDKETAKLARDIAREEKKMADFLVGLIDQLALDVVHDEVPVAEIGATPAARRSASGSRTRAGSSNGASARSKPATARAKAGASRAASKTKATASRAASKTKATASRATPKPKATSARAASRPKAASSRAASKPKSASSSRGTSSRGTSRRATAKRG